MDNQQLFPAVEDLAYAGGLLDADGSVGLYRNGNKKGLWFNPILSFYNNDENTVDWMRDLFRALGVEPHKAAQSRGGKVKTQYSVTVRKLAHIERLLPQLIPYLRLKRRRAEMVLEFSKGRLNRQGTDRAKQGPYTESELDLVSAVFLANGDYRNNAETVRAGAPRLKRQSIP